MSELARNIEAQPESLASTLDHQCGAGAHATEQAAALLRSAKKVVIAAMGASLFASLPLQYFLCSLGLDAVAIEAGELLHYLESAWKDAVVVMVSRSGESIEIIRLLEKMKGKVPVIGVSNVPDSRLSKAADVSLHIASLPDQIVAIQTYTGTLLALHLLGNAVAGSLRAAEHEARNLLPTFAALTRASIAAQDTWDQFLKSETTTYTLARGASLASAYEGALLFHETAKAPAVAMSIASFRHGPVEVVDPNFRGFVFVPYDSTRELNLALARDLVKFGGEIRLVGPSLEETRIAPSWDIPVLSQTLSPVFEILPLQVAALRLAIMRGIEPGSFRFAPQVAANEASFGSSGVSR